MSGKSLGCTQEGNPGAERAALRNLTILLLVVGALLAWNAERAAAAPPTAIATQGTGAGQVEDPTGVAVDPQSGDLYVADRNNFRIDKFDSAGRFQLAWGAGVSNPEVPLPQVCGPAVAPPPAKCFKLSPEASFPEGAGAVAPDTVAVEPSGEGVYVAESSRARVSKFSPEGEFLLAFGGDVTSSGPGNTGENEQQRATVKGSGGRFSLTVTTATGTGHLDPGSATVSSLATTLGAFHVGDAVSGVGLPAGATIVAVGPGTLTLSSSLDSTGSFRSTTRITATENTGATGIGERSAGSTEVTGMKTRSGDFAVGERISGAGIPAGTTIVATGPESLTLSAPATAASSAVLTASDIPYDADEPELRAALEGLPGIGAGNVDVTRVERAATEFEDTITFSGGPLAHNDIAPMTTTAANLDGAPKSAVVATTVSGGGPEVCEAARGDVCKAGSSGTAPGQFSSGSPTALAFDPESHLWVGDAGRVQQFDPAGAFVSQATIAGGGATQALAIDPGSGDFYLLSASLAGVRRYVPGGTPVDALTPAGSPLDEGGAPQALGVDADGNVYVGDRAAPYRLLRFDSAGNMTSQFGAGQIPAASGGAGPRGNALSVDDQAGALYVASSLSGANSLVQRFSIPQPGPLPEGQQAVDVLPTTATLSAELNPEGRATEYHFEYSTDESFDEETRPPQMLPTPPALPGFGPEMVSAPIKGLIPDTEYHFRLSASSHCNPAEPSEVCTVDGEAGTFRTPPAVSIDAQWAVDVGSTSASLKSELNPLGVPAEWWLRYGTDPTYGSATEPATLGDGFGDVTVAAQLTGLLPGKVYHYQFVARDERDGVVYTVGGPGDHTFTTGVAGAVGFTLPDSRAWERVTPADKGGATVVAPWLGGVQASSDGNGLSFVTVGSSAGAEGGRPPEPSESLAHRVGTEWVSTDITPGQETSSPAATGNQVRFFSTDLSRAAVEPRGLRVKDPTVLSDEASERTPYLRENLADPVRWRPLVTGKPGFANVPPGTIFGGGVEEQLHEYQSPVKVVGANPDLTHLIVQSSTPLSPEAGNVPRTLYEWSDGHLQLVSVLPESEGGGPSEGMLGYGSTALLGGSTINAVSADGRYVYWENKGEALPSALYVRDVVAGKTVRLDDRQPGSLGRGVAAPVFQGASADGGRAFFTDTQQLTTDAAETGADLYVCELVQGPGGAECALHDLTPETDGTSSEVQGVSAVDVGGDYVYYVANGALAPGAKLGDCSETVPRSGEMTPGTNCNLYVAHLGPSGWSTQLVAELSSADWHDWSILGRTAEVVASVSPSGRYLGFMSERSLTGYDSRDAASGEADEEVFRYDAVADVLTCVSCNPSGARPRGVLMDPELARPSADWGPGAFAFPLWARRWLGANLPDSQAPEVGSSHTYKPHSVLDNGRVLFNAFDSLVPADSNRTSDVYIYEGHGVGSCTPSSTGPGIVQAAGGGCVALLSSGTSDRESGLLDATPTGDDVFILTAGRLSALDQDDEYDIYDARVDEIAANPDRQSECLGEGCQPTVSSPVPVAPVSSSFRGPGNVPSPVRGKRCPRGKRRVRHKGKVRCLTKHRKRRHGKHRRRKHHRHRAHRVKRVAR